MTMEKHDTLKDRYVHARDPRGYEYVCRKEAVGNPDDLKDEEKGACFESPQWSHV